MPVISVVIPTRYRPQLVRRAIDSVLAQSYTDHEVVVIVDGPDPETAEALATLPDERVKVFVLAENVGLAEARNVGVRHASGEWVAFLDDDDEWLEDKLQYQLEAAKQLGSQYAFVCCKFLEKTSSVERVMPLTLPAAGQHFSEYIYCEGGYLQPSTFFASRALLLEIPFTPGLRYIEDTDWMLRATKHPQIKTAVVPKVLSIYYNYKSGGRESELTPWGVPFAWAKLNHHLFTKRAFPFYVARLCLYAKKAGRPPSTFFELLWLAFRHGRVTPKVLGYFVAYIFVSEGNLKRIRKVAGTFSKQGLPADAGVTQS